MNSFPTFLPAELSEALGWTLLHSLWQATFVAFIIGVALIVLRRASARTRYAVAASGMITTFVLIALTFALIYEPNIRSSALFTAEERLETIDTEGALQAENSFARAMKSELVSDVDAGKIANISSTKTVSKEDLEKAAQTKLHALQNVRSGSLNENLLVSASKRRAFELLQLSPVKLTPQLALMERIQQYLPTLVLLWFVGMIAFAMRLVGGITYAQRMKTYRAFPASREWQARVYELAHKLGSSHVPQLLESGLANVPMVVGFLKPVILVPMGFLTGLQAQHIEAILAHELAHIRRKDYLLSLMQAAIETLLFYHPAVWWMSSVMREEREHASDDLAARVCGDSRALASALAILEERNFAGHESAFGTASVAATDGHVLGRVKRLLGKQPERSFSLEYLAAYLVITCIFALTLTASPALQPMMKPVMEPIMENARKTASGLAAKLLPPLAPIAPASTLAPLVSDSNRTKSRPESWSNYWDEGNIGIEGFWEAKFKEKSLTLILFKNKRGKNRYNGTVYTGLQYSEVQGLNASQIRTSSGDVQFRLVKESGTFVFTGEANSGAGGGTYEFQVNTKFVEQMKGLGFNDVEEKDLVTLAVTDVNMALLRELSGLKLRTEEAVEIAVLGIKPEFVKEARQNGLNGEEIKEYGVLGIKNEYIKEMKQYGYNLDEIKELGVLGIKADYVEEMKKFGVKTDEIKEYGALGIRPDKVKELKDAGVPVDEIKEYGVLGIRPEYVNTMKSLGYKVEDIKEIGVLGIKPEMVKEYKDAGVPVDDIKEYGVLGIRVEYIKEMKALGYKIEEIKELGVLGIKPQMVKEYKDAGVPVDDIKEYGVLGIRVDYIKQMKSLGYKVSDIKEIGVLGIKPETVRAFKDAGLRTDDIKEFAILGIKPDFVKKMRAKGFSADEIREFGVRGLNLEHISSFRDAGFSREETSDFGTRGIKPEYVKQMKALGFSSDDIEELGVRGIKAETAKEYKALGFRVDDILELAVRGIKPSTAKEYQEAGFRRDDIEELAVRGIRPETAKEYAKAGFRTEDIAELAVRGIKPELAKEMKALGLSTDDIAELGVRGVRLSTIQKLKADGLSNARIVEILTDRD